MHKKAFVLLLILASAFTASAQKTVFSYEVYGNIANYFENENELLSFFNFRKGDVVAEIGAGNGKNIAGLSILVNDSLSFYVQDIDKTRLTHEKFRRIITRAKQHKKPLNHRYTLHIGTEKSTGLPDGIFDKILLVSTLHEFTYMDEMMTDIYRKLKTGGQLYILESHCRAKGHKNCTLNETQAIMERNGFSLVKSESKDLNGGTGMYRAVFRKK